MDKQKKRDLMRSVVSVECYEKGLNILDYNYNRGKSLRQLSGLRTTYLWALDRKEVSLRQGYENALAVLQEDRALLDKYSHLSPSDMSSAVARAEKQVTTAYSNWRGTPLKLVKDCHVILEEKKEACRRLLRAKTLYYKFFGIYNSENEVHLKL